MSQTDTAPIPVVLARRASPDPRATWELRVDERQRLQVVLVVQPGATLLEIPILTDSELRELLATSPAEPSIDWRCASCGAANPAGRRWCRVCSDHGGTP